MCFKILIITKENRTVKNSWPGIRQRSDFLVIILANEVFVNFVNDVLTLGGPVTLDIRVDLDQAQRGGHVILARQDEI